jgi:tetratricopeptide (TPR) repeat protein
MQPPAPETSVPEPFADTAAIEPPPGQPVPVPDIAPPPAGPYPQPAAESFDLRAELSDEEPTDKGFFVGPAPAPAAGLFEAGADEGGLFDLAAELEKDEELSASSSHGLGSAAAEFSFEETLSAFKKGVARTISEHDSATHYDLGIAYKEMGLYDEAIQEFLTSSRDPVRYFECMLMSVMIMREKGDLDKALRTCKTALLTPGAKENQMATLYFEMAQAFTAGNDRGRAKWSLEQAKSLHMDHPELDRMIGGLASVPAVPVALDQDVAEVAAAPPAEEPEIDLDKALGLEPEPAPEPGLEASDLGPEPMAQAVTDEPPADAGPFPSREQTSWEKAALEQPPDASEQAQATEQPKKKRKKISYV